jgi:hypothetical protein
MAEVKHDLLSNKFTRVFHEDESSFNAPHHFKVTDTSGQNLLGIVNFQEGAIKDVGVNGVFMEDLIHMCLVRLEAFNNSEYRCRENSMAITKLEETLMWLGKRTQGRTNRGVVGTREV